MPVMQTLQRDFPGSEAAAGDQRARTAAGHPARPRRHDGRTLRPQIPALTDPDAARRDRVLVQHCTQVGTFLWSGSHGVVSDPAANSPAAAAALIAPIMPRTNTPRPPSMRRVMLRRRAEVRSPMRLPVDRETATGSRGATEIHHASRAFRGVEPVSALTLDDQLTLLKNFDGGNIEGEVETLNVGPQQVPQKHISTLRYQPFTFAVGLAMGDPLAAWITTSLDLAHTRKTGSVVVAGAEGKAQSYCHFRDTLIEEITIPAMDATSKDPAFLTIRCQPEEITYAKGDDAIVRVGVDAKSERWLCSNFRVRIGQLPCGRVSKVDSFTIRQRIVESGVGRLPAGHSKEPINLEFPNIKVTFSTADFDPWQDWFSEFVIRGQNDQGNELQGMLEFLDPTMKGILLSIELSQIGIFSLKAERLEGNSDSPARHVAELYVEKMAIRLPKV